MFYFPREIIESSAKTPPSATPSGATGAAGSESGTLRPGPPAFGDVRGHAAPATVTDARGRERTDTSEVADAEVNQSSSQPGAHVSHVLTRTASVVWCRVCGRHAAVRLGVGLKQPCPDIADGAYPKRIERLRARLRPVTAASLL